jgi:hypothetical protein
MYNIPFHRATQIALEMHDTHNQPQKRLRSTSGFSEQPPTAKRSRLQISHQMSNLAQRASKHIFRESNAAQHQNTSSLRPALTQKNMDNNTDRALPTHLRPNPRFDRTPNGI